MVAGTKRAAAGGARVGGRGWGHECAFWSKVKRGARWGTGKVITLKTFFSKEGRVLNSVRVRIFENSVAKFPEEHWYTCVCKR